MVKYHNIFGAEEVDIEIPKEVFPTDKEIDAMEKSVPGCQHGWFESCYNKSKLHYRYWLPKEQESTELKGILVYMHGISTHTGKGLIFDGRKLSIFLMVDTFIEKGIAVYSFEQYGHGFSEGVRTYIPKSWEVNKNDYMTFCNLVSDRHPKDIPFFIMGESYGGTLTIHLAKHFQEHPEDGPSNFDSFLCIAPAVIADLPPFPVFQILRYGLAPLFPKWVPFFMPHPISPDRIWLDERVQKARREKRYMEMMIDGGGRPFRLGTVLEMVIALEEARKNAIPGLKVPFCVVHGTADECVLLKGSEFLMEHSATPADQKELHKIDGAFHDILCDPRAEESMDHLLQFVERQMERFKK